MEGKGPDPVHELARFANAITDPAVRRAFDSDPLGTLDREGVSVDALPEEVRDFITDLSYEELRLLARVQKVMTNAGFGVSTPYGSVAHL
jgi:hypothetical protein